MITEIENLKLMSEKLYTLRKEIDAKEEASKAVIDPLKVERDALQALLVIEMDKVGLKSIKTSSGDTFAQASRKGIEVLSEVGALKWAMENMAVSIDKRLVAQKLKDATEVPSCFALVESKYISVRKAKEAVEPVQLN